MDSIFAPATKESSKLRLAEFGPSGSGKTFTALRIATGIVAATGGSIALIDTERRSARKYSDRFQFDVCELDDRTIDGYCKVIEAAGRAKYGALIIDSMSHAWQELLTEVDRIAQTKFRGNTWSAWSEGTPKQRKFIDAILSCPCHIIATMRVDTEWTQEQDQKTGKTKPVKIGLKPQQGKGIEYEFDLLMELSPEHVGLIAKDRTGKFQDQTIEKPGEDFGKQLADWLAQGTPPAIKAERPSIIQFKKLIDEKRINDVQIGAWYRHFNVTRTEDFTDEQIEQLTRKIEKETAKSTAA